MRSNLGEFSSQESVSLKASPGERAYSINSKKFHEDDAASIVFDDEYDGSDMHRSSAWRAGYNVICTVVGTGLVRMAVRSWHGP